MMARLKGKTALVTAAGQGIGRAAALALAAEGATVHATDIDAGLLEEVAGQGMAGLETFRLDVLDPGEIEAARARAGAIDVLFNCTGLVHHGTVLESTEEEWDAAFALNVRAHYRMIRTFLPGMLEKGGGSIINMSSAVSTVKGVPDRFVYGTTKAAVIGMTKSIARDYLTQGIRCNAICPGTVETPSLQARMEVMGATMGGFDKARQYFLSRQPTGKLALPDDIAALVVYLASDESAFMTGQAIVIDGGWTL